MSKNPFQKIYSDLITVIPQEIIIKDVRPDGTIVAKHTSAPSEIIDTELGSITGGQFGLFYKPPRGSKAIAIRVFPGSTNHTQVVKSIYNPITANHDGIQDPKSDTEQGSMYDGNFEIEPGDVLLKSKNNQKVLLKTYSSGADGTLEVIDNSGNGTILETINSFSNLTTLSDFVQNINSGSRLISGDYFQIRDDKDLKKVDSHFDVVTRPKLFSENRIGLFYPGNSYDAYTQNKPRNPALTIHKQIINQVAESARFIGFDNEKQILKLKDDPKTAYSSVELGRLETSRKNDNLFFMSPDQLIEVVSGNLLSKDDNFNPININYGITSFNEFKTSKDIFQIQEDKNTNFLKIKNSFKRGIGYHFQLNTHDNILDDFSSLKNTRFILDKEGVLKVNLQKSSKYGNIMYVDDTSFMSGSDTSKVAIKNGFANPSKEEQIPITLRDNDGNVIYPEVSLDPRKSKKIRYTGIEFSNSNGYFERSEDGGSKIRVSTTKYHNMYSACEMLLSNYIVDLFVPNPLVKDTLNGVVNIGMAKNETFEKHKANFVGSLVNPAKKENQKNQSYGSVLISQADPIINPGGSTIVCGKEVGIVDPKVYSNNDSEQADSGSSYSGVSANLNLEGSIEASIGSDDADGKSITVDTKGGAVMWFGKDNRGRSMSVQTDGDVMFNIGGHGSPDGWSPGRLDLRVNLTNKGYLDEDGEPKEGEISSDSDVIISISEKGIIISGMKHDVPMMVHNSGSISIQSPKGIFLNGGTGGVKVIEKSIPARDAGVPVSKTANSINSDDPASIESVAELFDEVAELANSLT